MKAIILVGGEGTRLRPLTYEMPKQMLPLVGAPMIECVIAHLHRHGVSEVVLSLGYMPDRFIEAYPNGHIAGVKMSYAVESEPLDTAGAIRFAADYVGVDDTFLVINGDVLTGLDVTSLVAFHRNAGAQATIALHAVEDPSRFGVVPTTPEGRVIAFVEKPKREEAPTNLINAGFYVFEPSVLDSIETGRRVSVERETFPALAAAGTLFAMPDGGAYWLDTGTPQAYLQANMDVLKGEDDLRVGVEVSDGNWIADSATIATSATLRGAVIDANCLIGSHVVLEDVVLMPGATVQDHSVIRSSIVGPRAVIGSHAVLDATCVIGADVNVVAGSNLAGDVRLGGL